MEQIKFKDTLVHYRVFGNGNPLVFLHGFLEDSTMWDDFVQPLTSTNKIILIDLPCHGETRFSREICSMTFMAECSKAVLDNENIESPTIYGHSMGGYVGLELAKMINLKLVLVHSNFWADSEEKKEDRDRVVELIEDKKDFFIQIAIPNLFLSKNINRCANTISNLITGANKIDKHEIAAATLGLKNRSSNYEVLKTQNVVIIQGQYDNIIPLEQMVSELKSVKPEQKIHTIKNCGHMSIWEKPKELMEIIQQFSK